MSLKSRFKKFRNDYVLNQVKNVKIPDFDTSVVKRYEYIFSGRVQKVGFRLELSELSKRLGLVGYCKNLEDGSVYAHIQGEKNKIEFLVKFMESLKRMKITDKSIKELDLENDNDFLIV